MNKQTKFYLELIERKSQYEAELKNKVNQKKYYKLQEVNEIINIYLNKKA